MELLQGNLIRLLDYLPMEMTKKEEKKSEYKLRIIKIKVPEGDVYEVQVFRKFLWREWRTDVRTFEYKDDAEKLIECLKSVKNPEVVGEYKVKL